ncbi:MAG: hypothetical protein K2O40_12185, partial [Lachnospiraceae bacterium]|nr:hypothetical protein [Lachnospiraceae bacterium]
YRIFRSEKFGLTCWEIPKECLAENEKVVMRIYQASSRSYKTFKVAAYDDLHFARKKEFAQLELPQFVWCCEFFSYTQYMNEDRGAFASIILDATTSLTHDYVGAVIVIETVDKLFKKVRDGLDKKMIELSFDSYHSLESKQLLPIYDRNLEKY